MNKEFIVALHELYEEKKEVRYIDIEGIIFDNLEDTKLRDRIASFLDNEGDIISKESALEIIKDCVKYEECCELLEGAINDVLKTILIKMEDDIDLVKSILYCKTDNYHINKYIEKLAKESSSSL